MPFELIKNMSLIGPESWVKERLQAMKAAGVTTINVNPIAGDHAAKLKLIEQIKTLAADL